MAPLKVFAVGLGLLFSMPATAGTALDPISRWQPYIAETSRRFGVSEAWIVAVMRAESGGQTVWNGRPITSRAGAMGLMQLMPATWAAMRKQLGLGADPYDPRDNILAGSHYLRLLHDRFGYPGLFAAYNAGPARYATHLTSGRALPSETRAYLATFARSPSTPTMPPAIVSGERLFFARHSDDDASDRDAKSDGLFVRLSIASPRLRTY